ncbi:unnamed protein product [Closterium sp. NIES-64]|nr:unnamed protein product [Closterium sp. NIES-64]
MREARNLLPFQALRNEWRIRIIHAFLNARASQKALRPLVGQLPDFANREPKPIPASEPAPLGPASLGPLLWKWRCELGMVFGLSFGAFQPIFIAEPDLLHQIMVSKSSSFQKDQNSRRTVDFLANGLVFSEGAFWARQRKMITPAFSPASIKHAVTVMNDQARRAVQQWVHAVTHARDSNGSRSDSGSGVCEIDMYTAFTSLTLDIIGLAAFGNTVSSSGAGMGGGEGDAKETEGKRSVNGGEEEGRSVREVYEAVALLSTGSTKRMFSGRLFIPFYTWLPTRENKELQRAAEKVRRLSLDLIATRRQQLKSEPGKDLLAVMLAARDDVSNEQMTDQQLVDECVTFLVAGHETTAKLLTWGVYLLARFPEWQQRLREEVWQVMGEHGDAGEGAKEGGEEGEKEEGARGKNGGGGVEVAWEQVAQLRQMHMVLLETLRLFPPTPTITREASKAQPLCDLCASSMPAGPSSCTSPCPTPTLPILFPMHSFPHAFLSPCLPFPMPSHAFLSAMPSHPSFSLCLPFGHAFPSFSPRLPILFPKPSHPFPHAFPSFSLSLPFPPCLPVLFPMPSHAFLSAMSSHPSFSLCLPFRQAFPSFSPRLPILFPTPSHPFPHAFPSFSPRLPILFPTPSHPFPHAFPSFSPRLPILFPTPSHPFPHAFPSFSPRLPILFPTPSILFPTPSHPFPHAFPSFSPRLPILFPTPSHPFPHAFPSFSPRLPILFPTPSHPFPHAFPSFSPRFPILFPTPSHPFPHAFPSFSPRLPILFPTPSHPFPHAFPSFSPRLPILFPTPSHPFPHAFPSFSPRLPILFPTPSHPFPHAFPSFSPRLPILFPTPSHPFPHAFPSFSPCLPILYPMPSPMPSPLPHFPISRAHQDVSLGPYSIPAGTRIMMSLAMPHSDPRYWGEDALHFNPARFKDGIQGACSHPQAFVPFSAGPRDCIGSNFALTEAKVVLAHLLRRLQWELSPTYVHLPSVGITLTPKYGMPLRMRLVE